MKLGDVAKLNIISIAVKLCVMLFVNKLTAIYAGTNGYAIVGQFNNILSILITCTSGSFGQGIVKYTSENKSDAGKILNETFILSCFMSLLCIVLIIFFYSIKYINISEDILILIIFTIPFIAINNLLIPFLNGLEYIGDYYKQIIIYYLIMFCVMCLLLRYYQIEGGVCGIFVTQILLTFYLINQFNKNNWYGILINIKFVKNEYHYKLISFFGMSLIASIMMPASQIIIREIIISSYGFKVASNWQGVFKISEMYLMFFISTLSVYFLPEFSKAKDYNKINGLIKFYYLKVFPFVILSSCIVYLLKDLIVEFLFTDDFKGMTSFFKWQLMGDILKLGSWVLGFVLISKAQTKLFIIIEILFSASWIILTIVFTKIFGVEGVSIAFASNYLIYWITLYFIYSRFISKNE